MKNIFAILVVLIILVIGGLLVAPGFVDWEEYGPRIVEEAEKATGYKLTIESLDAAVFPSPRLRMAGLAVALPETETSPFVTLEKAEIAVALWPLLSQQVVVDSVTLVRPVITLQTGENGKPSWALPLTQSTEPAEENGNESTEAGTTTPAQPFSVTLNRLSIEDGTFQYAGAAGVKPVVLEKINMTLQADSLTGPFTVEGGFHYGAIPVILTAGAGRADMDAGTIAVQSEVALPASDSILDYAGVVAWKEGVEIQGDTTLSTNSIAGMLAPLTAGGLPPVLNRPLKIGGLLTVTPEKAAFRDIVLSSGDVSATGTVDISLPKGGSPLSFQAGLNAPELKGLVQGVAPPGPVSLSLKGNMTGQALVFESLSLKDGANNTVNLSGKIADMAAFKGIDLKIGAKTADAGKLLKDYGQSAVLPEGIKEADLDVTIKGAAKEMVRFDAALRAVQAVVNASTTIKTPADKPETGPVVLHVTHPDYAALARVFAPDFKAGGGKLDVKTQVEMDGPVVSLKDVRAQVGPAVFGGAFDIKTDGPRPAVTGTIKAGTLPLDKLLGATQKAGSSSTQKSGSSFSGGKKERWPSDPIDGAGFRAIDLSLKGTAETVSLTPWTLNDAALDIDLKDGALRIKQIDAKLLGGQIALTGELSAPVEKGQPLDFKGKTVLQNVNLSSLVKTAAPQAPLKADGIVSLEADLSAKGASVAALVLGLNGKSSMDGKNIIVQGIDLAKLSRTLTNLSSSWTENITGLMDSTLSGGQTQFDTLTGAFTVTNGVINADTLNLIGQAATIDTAGQMSLPAWTIDMTSTMKLTEPEDAPPIMATFKGSLDKPVQTFGRNPVEDYIRARASKVLTKKLSKELEGTGIGKTLQDVGILAPSGSNETGNGEQGGASDSAPAAPEAFRGLLEGVLGQ